MEANESQTIATGLAPGEIAIMVTHPDGSPKRPIAAKPDHTVDQVVAAVREPFGLRNVDGEGRPITYTAVLKRGLIALNGDSRVGDLGLVSGDELMLKTVTGTGR